MHDNAVAGLRSASTIELSLTNGSQLFNTLDPFPFRQRDLSADAEQYIVEWAEELSKDRAIEIVIDIETEGEASSAVPDLAAAIGNWFDGRARSETKAMRQLFRDGRLAFLIGLIVLSACLFIAWWLSERLTGPFARGIQESFVIIGWVVIWRPAEMFLYDWLPMLRRRTLYRRLAAARVTVRKAPARTKAGPNI